ncbi:MULTISPECIES: hypothetical protein [unclassified Gordonia (in: high G+C Gram-positive bacteria)]
MVRKYSPGTTVTRYCASSVQAARVAMHAIQAGEGGAFVVAGPWIDPCGRNELPDVYIAMGQTAKNVTQVSMSCSRKAITDGCPARAGSTSTRPNATPASR